MRANNNNGQQQREAGQICRGQLNIWPTCSACVEAAHHDGLGGPLMVQAALASQLSESLEEPLEIWLHFIARPASRACRKRSNLLALQLAGCVLISQMSA